MEESKRLAVITGCDSGIGRALCKILLREGFTVLISVLRSNPFDHEKNCIARYIISKRGKIDALIVSLPKRLIDLLISRIFYLDYKE